MFKSLNEECGVFGVYGHPNAARLTYYGLHSLQHRGQEAAGIVVSDGKRVNGHRGPGLVSEVFNDDRIFNRLEGNSAIGHVRYATSGSSSGRNIQPFLFQFFDGSIALAHNGNLINAKTLKRELEEHGAIFHSSSDTEVLVHLIRRSKEKDFLSQLKDALRQVKGGFSFVIQTQTELYGAVDPFEFRPLILGKAKNGAYILASETCALEIVGAEFIRNIRSGEVAIIDESGYRIEKYTENTTENYKKVRWIEFFGNKPFTHEPEKIMKQADSIINPKEWTKEEKSMFDERRRDFDGYYAHLAYVREEKEQAIAEGLEQGLQQGLEQGREEGIEQGIAQERVKTISIFVDLVKEGHLTREMGASKLNLSEQEFEKYLKSK